MIWLGWPLDRAIVLLVGAAYIPVAIQAAMFHYRQNFRHIAMWAPVVEGPAIGLAAILLAAMNIEPLLGVVTALFWLGALSGLIGFYYHFRGVGQRVDGFLLRNFLVGPPIILPLTFSVLGVIGLFAIYWR